MKVQPVRPILITVVALALAVLACGGSVEPTATPLPRPTQKPVSTATALADTAQPTRRPSATPGQSENTKFTLSDKTYDHPSGAFSVRLPEGWELGSDSEKDNSLFITSPDGVVAVELSFVNVGAELDAQALDNFIQAVEDNWFATFPKYEAGNKEPQPDGSIGVSKTLELSGGTPQTVFSYYWQAGTVVYEQDFWVDSDQYDTYVDGLIEMANSMTTDPAAGAKADLYAIVYTFTGPNSAFEFQVPYSWSYTTDTSTDNTIIDTFTSPDQLTYVENITYDDGKGVEAGAQRDFAISELQARYQADDLEVVDEATQEDGSVRLTWKSASGNIDGASFYEARETAFLLLTWIVGPDAQEMFVPVWKSLIGSYGVPKPDDSTPRLSP